MSGQKMVLIIDDEPDLRDIIQLRVQTLGHDVIMAANGEEGLAQARQHRPDLIITDVLMPKVDGYALYKELKKDPRLKDVPVLVLTARGKMEDTFKVLGVDEFITKPFEGPELMSKVEKLLSARGAPTVVQGAATTEEADPSMDTGGKRVLVVGSQEKVMKGMLKDLRKLGCFVQLTANGREAPSLMSAFHPELVLLDVEMDDMSAADIIRQLRESPQSRGITILIYSYYTLAGAMDMGERNATIETLKENCLEQGAFDYLGCYDENTFLKVINTYL